MKELLENGYHGVVERKVNLPATIEDEGVVEVARGKVGEYFQIKGRERERKGGAGGKAKL